MEHIGVGDIWPRHCSDVVSGFVTPCNFEWSLSAKGRVGECQEPAQNQTVVSLERFMLVDSSTRPRKNIDSEGCLPIRNMLLRRLSIFLMLKCCKNTHHGDFLKPNQTHQPIPNSNNDHKRNKRRRNPSCQEMLHSKISFSSSLVFHHNSSCALLALLFKSSKTGAHTHIRKPAGRQPHRTARHQHRTHDQQVWVRLWHLLADLLNERKYD